MIASRGYAAAGAKALLGPFSFARRESGPPDVQIEVAYCGVCHSDLHQVREEWGPAIFPMVPGHVIVGTVSAVGSAVTKFAVGDRAGVGCLVDSCRTCVNCSDGEEQYGNAGATFTCNSTDATGAVSAQG